MTIEERLERLERENRRLKYLLFSLLFLIAGVFFIGARTINGEGESSIPDEIKAKKFTLVDDNGKGRAVLGIWKGLPGLVFFSEAGELRVGLLDAEKLPSLGFQDENGKTRLVLGTSKEQGPFLELCDENGKTRVRLLSSALGLYDEGGKPKVVLGVSEKGSLFSLSGEGKSEIRLGMADARNPFLSLADEEGKIKAALTITNEEGCLGLTDNWGNVKFFK
jgi:hypothetical protein